MNFGINITMFRLNVQRFFWKKYSDGTSMDIAIHVNDGLVTMDSLPRLNSLLVALKAKLKIIKITEGIKHVYISMVLEFNKDSRSVNITTPKYAKKIVDEYPLDTYNRVMSVGRLL